MEFLSVGASKIKVILSPEECASYGIRADTPEPSDKEVRAAIASVLAHAEREIGFRVGNERLLIQLYPLGGGCELFITKLSSLGERERKAITEADNLTTYQGRDAYFAFRTREELLGAMIALGASDAPHSVYRAHTGEYYIQIREQTVDGLSDVEIISEYGMRLPSLPLGIEGEWGTLISSVGEEGDASDTRPK